MSWDAVTGVVRAVLRAPPYLVFPALTAFIEANLGARFGCLIGRPPGFVCLRQWAIPVPAFLPAPLDEIAAWTVPSVLAYLVWVSGREGVYELLGGALGRLARKTILTDPYALLGTADQGGLRPPGWKPIVGAGSLAGFDSDALLRDAERAVELVQWAWAGQDPMAAREVVCNQSWSVLSVLIDDSRRRRRAGIRLTGLEVVEGRVLTSGEYGGEEAALARLTIRCQDPPTQCEQDWTFVRPVGGGHWQVAAVEPHPPGPIADLGTRS
jgi:hypothetical protein